jgi:hypothetical protein
MKMPGEAMPGPMESVEEDLFTLYQFDHYLKQAQNKRKLHAGNDNEMDTSSDESETASSFLHDILNVALINWVCCLFNSFSQ